MNTHQYLHKYVHPPSGSTLRGSSTGMSRKCWHTPGCRGFCHTHLYLHSSCRLMPGRSRWCRSSGRNRGCSHRSEHTDGPGSASTRLHRCRLCAGSRTGSPSDTRSGRCRGSCDRSDLLHSGVSPPDTHPRRHTCLLLQCWRGSRGCT